MMTAQELYEFALEQSRVLRIGGEVTLRIVSPEPERIQVYGEQDGRRMMGVELLRAIYLALLSASNTAAYCEGPKVHDHSQRIGVSASMLAELLRDIDQMILDGEYDGN